MRKIEIYQLAELAGTLEELEGDHWRFTYSDGYVGRPISLALPLSQKIYEFEQFPPLLEGLLPEGAQLEAMLRRYKIDRKDLLGQLIRVGQDVIGSITIKEVE